MSAFPFVGPPSSLLSDPARHKAFDLREHSAERKLSRCCSDAGALKLQDLLTLSSDLEAHMLDFGTDVI
jgi:hypothetical protein